MRKKGERNGSCVLRFRYHHPRLFSWAAEYAMHTISGRKGHAYQWQRVISGPTRHNHGSTRCEMSADVSILSSGIRVGYGIINPAPRGQPDQT